MMSGCYTLDLYCDHPLPWHFERSFSQFTGRTESECLRQAKRAGWVINKKTGVCKCPEHRKWRPKKEES